VIHVLQDTLVIETQFYLYRTNRWKLGEQKYLVRRGTGVLTFAPKLDYRLDSCNIINGSAIPQESVQDELIDKNGIKSNP